MKRSPLKPKSKKTARTDRQLAKVRAAFLMEMGVIGEVHEIVGGSSRSKTKQDRRFWLAVTPEEHKQIQYESKKRQMARKFLQDPKYYDREAVNDLYRVGGSEWPITEKQVIEEVLGLMAEGKW